MTPAELKDLRLNARITVLESLVVAIINRNVHSSSARIEQAKELDAWVASLEQVKFPQLSPEYADLFSAELQQAAESLAQLAKNRLAHP